MGKVNFIKKHIYIHKDKCTSIAYYTMDKPEKNEYGIYNISIRSPDRYRLFNGDFSDLLDLRDLPQESLFEVEITARVKQLE